MTLREHLNQLLKQVGLGNEPNDEVINWYLQIACGVVEAVKADMVENEPYATYEISSLEDALEAIPGSCKEIAEIEEGRKTAT